MPVKEWLQIAAISLAMQMSFACAGRDAHPIATTQLQDNTASCTAIQAEADANTLRISQLSHEEGWKVAQNVGAGIVGLFTFGIGWVGMDFKDAAGTERQAIESRNQYLAQLSVEKCRQTNVVRSE